MRGLLNDMLDITWCSNKHGLDGFCLYVGGRELSGMSLRIYSMSIILPSS